MRGQKLEKLLSNHKAWFKSWRIYAPIGGEVAHLSPPLSLSRGRGWLLNASTTSIFPFPHQSTDTLWHPNAWQAINKHPSAQQADHHITSTAAQLISSPRSFCPRIKVPGPGVTGGYPLIHLHSTALLWLIVVSTTIMPCPHCPGRMSM